MRMFAAGLNNNAVASLLNVDVMIINRHQQNIELKLRNENSMDIVYEAYKQGYLRSKI